MMCRADVGWGTTHAEAFSEWLAGLVGIAALQLGAAANALQLYVVFDNKRGGRMGATPVRQAAVPGYLNKRHVKERQELGRSSSGGGDNSASGAASTSCGAGAAADAEGSPPGTSAASSQLQQRPPEPAQQQQQRARVEELAAQAAALMDMPPSHLAPFVAAVRRLGGLALYGLPGYEADDMIGSLVARMLLPGEENPLPNASGAGGPIASSSRSSLPLPTPLLRGGLGSAAAGRDGGLAGSEAGGAPAQVLVASADSDMLQLLALPGCRWLELRQLSRAASAQQPLPLAVRAEPLPGVPAALMRLHTALPPATGSGPPAGAQPPPGPGSDPALPAACLPDYLALVGKPEAGVPGVGLSRRAARRLLARYGSIEGVERAHAAGLLDERLRPAAPRTAAAATAGMSSAPRGAGALAQALRNIRATRMHTDLASVPWARVRAYQRERMAAAAPAPAAAPRPSSIALGEPSAPAAGGVPSLPLPARAPAGSVPEHSALPHALLHLHPYDRLHRSSAAPFCGVLAGALRRRGLACRTDHVDEGGQLYDLVVSMRGTGGGTAASSRGNGGTNGSGMGVGCGVVSPRPTGVGAGLQQAGGGGMEPLLGARGAASAAAAAQLLLPAAAADAAAASLAALLANGGSMLAASKGAVGQGGNVSSSSSSQAVEPLPPALGELRVALLSPWDFNQKQLQEQQGPRPKQPPQQGVPQQQGVSGPAHQATTSALGAAKVAASAPPVGGEGQRLLAFATELRSAAGPRCSQLHTPSALQGLLRSTSAWRLKGMQRGGGAPLAVVPFYDLLLPVELPPPHSST